MDHKPDSFPRESYSTPTLVEHPPLTDVTGGTGDER
jgi:hypothetical protein